MKKNKEEKTNNKEINQSENLIKEETETNNEPVSESTVEASSVQEAVKKQRTVGGILCKTLIALIVVVFLFTFGFTYQVREGSCAVVMRFGAVRDEVTQSGLYFKLPWPFENVVTYDSKLQYLESKKLETTTEDKSNIILQSYVVWNIEDPTVYHNSVGTTGLVESYINDQVFSATNSILGKYKLSNIVSLEKEEIKLEQIQEEIFERVKENCINNYGVNVKDVSILRLSLPDTNLDSVFEQMWAERKSQIDKIIADANKEANDIINKGEVDAAGTRGQGAEEAAKIKAQAEKEVAEIYAKAQEANFDLFEFLTDLDTMVNSINSSTVLVVKADQYPFNILTKYSKDMTTEGTTVALHDLTNILASENLSQEDHDALISAFNEIITKSAVSQA